MSEEHNKHNEDSVYKERSLFGRRQGRALRGERSRVLDDILPLYSLKSEELPEDHSIPAPQYFNNKCSQYWLEIGFGHGEHVAGLLKNNPDHGILAAEPFVNGMSAFLKDHEDSLSDNLRLHMQDGMQVAKSLAPNSLDGIYVLNPDPWHKTRHHKRRIINQKNLDIMAKILKPGGQLIMTTDVPYLGEWMLTQALNHPEFVWQAKSKTDFYAKPKGWITTRYEEKGAKGAKKMVYLFFERI